MCSEFFFSHLWVHFVFYRQNVPRARKELTNLNNHATPLGKLHVIKRVVRALSMVTKRASNGESQSGTSISMVTDNLDLPVSYAHEYN